MFSLVHFSRVFPYIHPYLFPLEPTQAVQASADDTSCVYPEPTAATSKSTGIRGASVCSASGQGRRLKNLHRRHLRSQRNDALTYSGVLRHSAW